MEKTDVVSIVKEVSRYKENSLTSILWRQHKATVDIA